MCGLEMMVLEVVDLGWMEWVGFWMGWCVVKRWKGKETNYGFKRKLTWELT
jgi:hypothetical protein